MKIHGNHASLIPRVPQYHGRDIQRAQKATGAVFLVVLLFLLPIDWFEPTGEVFREAGAKPSILIIGLGCALSILMYGHNPSKNCQSRWLWCSLLVPLFGLGAFSYNQLNEWSEPLLYGKTPNRQFLYQSMLLAFSLTAPFFLSPLIKPLLKSDFLINAVFYAAIFHFTIFLFEWFSPDASACFLSYFRGPSGLIDRPSGLMSEPSYFGVFAALYAVPLIMYSQYSSRRIFIGLAIVACAVLINAKTIAAVFLGQILIFFWYRKRTWLLWVFAATGGMLTLYFIHSGLALNVSENLSSAMRLGSAVLGLNLIFHGYSLSGVGTGQFHFFYSPKFASDWLLAPPEFSLYLDGSYTSRASVFNLPIRAFVEFGIAGGIFYFYCMYRIICQAASAPFPYPVHRRSVAEPSLLVGLSFTGGGLGFLLTQDTYCYPPLIFGLSLLIASTQTDGRTACHPCPR